MSFEDIPVDVGVIYEGERIRWPDTYVELGGPRIEYKFELVKSMDISDIDDGNISVNGPDIIDVEAGTSLPFGLYIEVAGEKIEKDLEGVIERRLHEYCNYIQGFMHINQRYDIHLRLSNPLRCFARRTLARGRIQAITVTTVTRTTASASATTLATSWLGGRGATP